MCGQCNTRSAASSERPVGISRPHIPHWSTPRIERTHRSKMELEEVSREHEAPFSGRHWQHPSHWRAQERSDTPTNFAVSCSAAAREVRIK